MLTLPDTYQQSFLGFDRLFDSIAHSALETAAKSKFPFYDVAKTDDGYIIEMALAGFSLSDVEIYVEEDRLKVSSSLGAKFPENCEYVYKGISRKGFNLSFNVAPSLEVTEAAMKDGILKITLKNIVPDNKSKKIEIKSA